MSEADADPAPVVRDATMADVPALERCYAAADHAQRVRTADGRMRRYLVVEAGGEVVGFGRLMLAELPGQPPVGLVPRISNLNVRPDVRRHGLATALIREMERLARSAGHERLYIGAASGNDPALSLYRRLGYEPAGLPPASGPRAPAGPGGTRAFGAGRAVQLVRLLGRRQP